MVKSLQRQNILIVDDVPANIKILQATLMDYHLSAATSGPEAIEIALSNPPDLILLDIMMPDMSGYDVCKWLKSDARTQNIPVIFITARSQEEEETKGFEMGAVDYITKPFSPAIVKARVNTHLALKRNRDHLEELNSLLIQEIAERNRSENALKYLLKKQEMNIGLAKKLLRLINGDVPRYIEISKDLMLFVDAVSIPCYAEGGDHYFVRFQKSDLAKKHGKTLFSLKDQSGHEVGCVLRSIITDFIHNSILNISPSLDIEQIISQLNDKICDSQFFDKEDFFTSINAEIDHETLVLKYVSTGHPPFLFIRNKVVHSRPSPGKAGSNIPIAITSGITYVKGEFQLQEGDQLLFYTDGLTEMPLKNEKKMISLQELEQMINEIVNFPKAAYHPPVSEIMNDILNRISKMSCEEVVSSTYENKSKNTSADDVTLLCIEIENRNKYTEDIWKPIDSDHLAKYIIILYEKLKVEWHQRGYMSPEMRLRMVLEEAVLNAWIHGNKRHPEKSIYIRWRFGNDFHLEIIDEGNGFDYERIPDPRSAKNLTKPTGRGIFIVRYFSDHVAWRKNGRCLMISFRKSPDCWEILNNCQK